VIKPAIRASRRPMTITARSSPRGKKGQPNERYFDADWSVDATGN
jgi:hypothetical protein